jgi:hypothetical protein
MIGMVFGGEFSSAKASYQAEAQLEVAEPIYSSKYCQPALDYQQNMQIPLEILSRCLFTNVLRWCGSG